MHDARCEMMTRMLKLSVHAISKFFGWSLDIRTAPGATPQDLPTYPTVPPFLGSPPRRRLASAPAATSPVRPGVRPTCSKWRAVRQSGHNHCTRFVQLLCIAWHAAPCALQYADACACPQRTEPPVPSYRLCVRPRDSLMSYASAAAWTKRHAPAALPVRVLTSTAYRLTSNFACQPPHI